MLVPSVGLCLHPWLFADRGLSVVATDVAASALAVLSRPEDWPRLFSPAARERWDIAQSGLYATPRHPDRFDRMPDLTNPETREALRGRITFAECDWAALPVADGGVDAIFATNALPRGSDDELRRVLAEWVRVVRPGGGVLIAQHNFTGSVEPVLLDAGWVEADLLRGERPAGRTGFQVRYSSG